MDTIKSIDINCDLGEGVNELDCQRDQLLMPYLSSCNIACGGHAGNQLTMELSLSNANASNLKIGAHPGYPDKRHFGRVSLDISTEELEKSVYSQIQALVNTARKTGGKVTYIKFHGALYNDIEKNDDLAMQMAEFCKRNFPKMSLLGLANGNLKQYCQTLRINFIAEGFMDRRYLANGKLSPRTQQGAVIEEKDVAIRQALALASGQPFLALDNSRIAIAADSICLHGDNPNAIEIAKSLVNTFSDNRITIG